MWPEFGRVRAISARSRPSSAQSRSNLARVRQNIRSTSTDFGPRPPNMDKVLQSVNIDRCSPEDDQLRPIFAEYRPEEVQDRPKLGRMTHTFARCRPKFARPRPRRILIFTRLGVTVCVSIFPNPCLLRFLFVRRLMSVIILSCPTPAIEVTQITRVCKRQFTKSERKVDNGAHNVNERRNH